MVCVEGEGEGMTVDVSRKGNPSTVSLTNGKIVYICILAPSVSIVKSGNV